MSGTDILPKTLPLNEQIHIYALHLMLFKENELKSGGGNNTCLTQEPEPTVHSSLRRRLRLHYNIICLQTGVQVYMQYVGLMWGHYGSSTCLAELSSSLS